MTRFQQLLNSHSVDPQTAAAWANVDIKSFYDAYYDDEAQSEIMLAWGLVNIFSLAQHLKISPSELVSSHAFNGVDPSSLHSQIKSHLIIQSKKLEFEERCGWELNISIDYDEWLRQVFFCWCPEELKDICECLGLNWLTYLNGLFAEWKKGGV